MIFFSHVWINIIYELINRNGKVKEYLGGSLKFEGEYLNGLRHWKGKEYYDKDSLIFEGEYLNGKWNGKGKEYNGSGKLLFEGEYLNGKKKGYGREYNETYGLSFEDEFINGKRNGQGKILLEWPIRIWRRIFKWLSNKRERI